MEALRLAATLAHTVPAIRVRLRHEGRVVVDVAQPGTPIPAGTARAVTPCGFRTAVAGAWERHRSGEPVSLLGLPADPSVELGVPPCGRSFPAGIHRVAMPGRQLYVVGASLPNEVCRAETTAYTDPLVAPAGMWGLGLREDTATEVTVIYAELDAHHLGNEPAVLDVLEGLVARLAVRRLLDGVPNPAAPR